MEEETVKKKNITSEESTDDIKMEIEMEMEMEEEEDLSEELDVVGYEIDDGKNPLLTEDIPEPEYDENEVILSFYDSDLNLVMDEATFTVASPVHDGGFCYLQAGARATYGYNSGKVCFEVKILEYCNLTYRKGHIYPHVLCVGWSSMKSNLQLGRDKKSYGFHNTAKIITAGEKKRYGKKFKIGDVVGAFLDIGNETVTLSFTVNGEDQGIAYKVPKSELVKEPLFPHILAKNIWYQCNFKGETPWFPPKEGYTFVGDVPLTDRVSGPKRPMSKSDCEVVMMCGLPKVGKTTWVNELIDKNPGMYYVLDPMSLVDSWELNNASCKKFILERTKIMGKLLAMAMDRRRNYILDQINLTRTEQIWKLRLFKGFKRRIVVIVLPDKEYMNRLKETDEKLTKNLYWLFNLKAKFVLPTLNRAPICSFVEQIDYVALPQSKALKLVKMYHQESWGKGFKPNKYFVLSPNFKYGKKKGKGKKHKKSAVKEKDLPGSAADEVSASMNERSPPAKRPIRQDWEVPPGKHKNLVWIAPSRNKTTEDWQVPPGKHKNRVWVAPSRNKTREEHVPLGKRTSEDRHSPPRKKAVEAWQSPLNRPDGGSRSLSRGTRRDDSWSQENRREMSKSPPRFRTDGRRESREGERSPPRSRMEAWQSRGPRLRGDRTSPSRRRPDGDARPASLHSSPPRSRTKPQDPERNRDRDGSRHRYHDDNSGDRNRPPPADVASGDWLPRVAAAMPSEFHPRERNVESIHSRDGRISGGPPGHKIRASGPSGHKMRAREPPGHEFRTSGPSGRGLDEDFSHGHPARADDGGPSGSLSLQEARMGGGYPRGDTRTRSSFPSSPQRMNSEFSLREAEFGRDLPPSEERISNRMCFQEPTLGPGYQPQEHMIGEGYSHKEERDIDDFSFRDVRIEVSRQPLEGKAVGPVRMLESQMGGGFSPPRGRIANDCLPTGGMLPPLQRRGGLAPNERGSGSLPSLDSRSARSLSPGRRIATDIYSPEDKSKGRVPPDRVRSGAGYPHERERGNEILPSQTDRSGAYVPNPGRRIRMLPLENRSGRTVDDLPPQRMSGDLPPSEGRMSDNFHPGTRQGKNLHSPRDSVFPSRDFPLHSSPHEGRTIGDFPSLDRRMMGDLVHRGERLMGDLPPREGQMMNELTSCERRIMSDLPPHEGRMMGELTPHEGRMMDLASREGRATSDFLSSGERMMRNFPPCEGRNISELPPQEGRMGGDLLPHERMSGNFPSRGGRIGGADVPPPHGRMVGDMPTGGRMVGNFPPGGRTGMSDMPHLGGDLPPPAGRTGHDFLQRDKFGDNMSASGERMVGDLPLGGRMGSSDFPTEGRVGSSAPPHGGRFGGDIPHRGERPSSDLLHHGGRLVGDLPFHGGRIASDYSPRGGRFDGGLPPCDIGMSGDLQQLEGRNGSGDRWNRLQTNTNRSSNYGLKVKQESLDESKLQFRSKGDFLQPKGGDNGAGPGHWNRIQSSNFGPPIKTESLKDVDFRNKEEFLQSKGRDGSRGIRRSRWSSPTQDNPFKAEGENRESGGTGPSYHFMEDRENVNSGRTQLVRGADTWKSAAPLVSSWKSHESQKPERRNIPPLLGRPLGRPLSPGQQIPGQQPPRGLKSRLDSRSPFGRSAEIRQTAVGRPESGRQSPVAGSSGRQRGSARDGMHWQSSERSHVVEGGRLPPNVDRPTSHNPLQKQPRMSGPNVLCPDGGIEVDVPFGSGWKPPQLGSVDAKCDPLGGGARNRLPEGGDCEELAPYEQPFNQSVWDSNEPDAGLASHPVSEGHAGRTRESGGNRPQYLSNRAGNKPPGSIWQRVGGYVDDDEERGTQETSESHRFSNQNLSGGHFGESKERNKDYKESSRRGRELKEGSGSKKRFNPYHVDKGSFPRDAGGSRGRWRSPDKPRSGRW